ncbi:MAG: tetratricopeptide repeat protein, partial [Sandaracinaceae bacterium]|nr:tetratricopeptide repeat protein [Sandaracinaceae bacterium]
MRVLAILLVALVSFACGGAPPSPTQLTELPPVNPEAVREFAAGARLLAQGGRAREQRAVEHFQRAIALDANVWEAHYNIGVIRRRGGELWEAIESFEAARQIQFAVGEVLIGLAEARYALGETDQAA